MLAEFENKLLNVKDQDELDAVTEEIIIELIKQKEINNTNEDINDFKKPNNFDKYEETDKLVIEKIITDLEDSLDNALTRDQKFNLQKEALDKINDFKIYNLVTTKSVRPDKDFYKETLTNALHAHVNASNGVNSNVVIKSKVLELTNTKDLEKLIKDNLVTAKNNQNLSDVLKTLKKQSIFGTLNIGLYRDDIKVTEYDGTYTVSLLLPDDLKNHTNISVLYNGNNVIEVFKVRVVDEWITFETDHFSQFYLIGDSLVVAKNNIWLIIMMLVVITIESIIIIRLRKKNEQKRQRSLN